MENGDTVDKPSLKLTLPRNSRARRDDGGRRGPVARGGWAGGPFLLARPAPARTLAGGTAGAAAPTPPEGRLMPRTPRRWQWTEAACYHVMDRGHNRETVFADDEDRRHFLELLARYRDRFGLRLYHYCLMGNHFHLLWKM